MKNQEPVNKCDTCQNQFSCTSETGNCEEGKEKYEVLSYDLFEEAEAKMELYFVAIEDLPESP